jgi:hypothetical protein
VRAPWKKPPPIDPAREILMVWTHKTLPELQREAKAWINENERGLLLGELDRVNSALVADVISSTYKADKADK